MTDHVATEVLDRPRREDHPRGAPGSVAPRSTIQGPGVAAPRTGSKHAHRRDWFEKLELVLIVAAATDLVINAVMLFEGAWR